MALLLSSARLVEILRAFKRELEETTGKRLTIYLFGSYVKGYQDVFSDVDLLVLTPEDWTREDEEKLHEFKFSYNLRHNLLLSVITIPQKRLESPDIFVRKVLKEGVKIDG